MQLMSLAIRFVSGARRRVATTKMLVDVPTTATVITRESGLKPLTMSTFEVRACSGHDVGQEKKTVSAFVGRL